MSALTSEFSIPCFARNASTASAIAFLSSSVKFRINAEDGVRVRGVDAVGCVRDTRGVTFPFGVDFFAILFPEDLSSGLKPKGVWVKVAFDFCLRVLDPALWPDISTAWGS